MALAVDGSTPGVATNAVGTTSPVTSSSFNPPGASLLLPLWAANSQVSTNPSAPTITDNLGVHLTYTLTDWQSHADSPNRDGQAAGWSAPTGAGGSMTVTVNNNAASGSRESALSVQVITGADPATPVGAHGKTGSGSTASIAQSFTAQRTGSWGFLAVSDWDLTGAMTAGAGTTLIGSANVGSAFTYGFFRRTTADGVAGASTTLNVNLGGTSTNVEWVWIEVLPAAGVAASPPLILPPDLLMQIITATQEHFSNPDTGVADASPTADVATSTWTAPNPATTVAPGSTGPAVIAVAASDVAARVAPTADRALATLTAPDPTAAIAPAGDVAATTLVAGAPTVAVSVNAGVAGIGLAAGASTAAVSPTSGTAVVGLAASDVTAGVATHADVAPINLAALPATTLTGTIAAAGAASVTAAAGGPTSTVAPHSDVAAVALVAPTPQVALGPTAGAASVALIGAASAAVGTSPGPAAVGLASAGPTAGVAPHTDAAPVTVRAQDAQPLTGTVATAGPAGVSVAAGTVQAAVAPHSEAAQLAVSAGGPTTSLGPGAGVASITWTAPVPGVTAVDGGAQAGVAALVVAAPGAAIATIPTDGVVVSGGTPVIGLCGSWEPVFSCALPTGAEAVTGQAVEAATEVLWSLTGRRFGLCTLTLRPCRRDCAFDDWHMWWEVGTGVSGLGGGPRPLWFNGMWFNISCGGGCGSGGCSCTALDEVVLPGPVHDVLSVKVDGVTLTKNVDYRLDDYRLLVRLGGQLWPLCNDLSKADTEADTWSVTARFGEDVPTLGKLAVGALALEFTKLLLCDDSCLLPRPIQSIVRQGINITFLDPNVVLNDGKTGLYVPDLFIQTVNSPGAAGAQSRRRGQVYDIDSYPGNARKIGTG